MTNKYNALRIAFKAFYILHCGGTMSREDYKAFADLCGVCLPMKYRFTRAELDEIRAKVEQYEPARSIQ